MGGFYKHERCIELLRSAAEALYEFGYQDESEAVEQAISLLKARPSPTDCQCQRCVDWRQATIDLMEARLRKAELTHPE